jgi:hypothetical protein
MRFRLRTLLIAVTIAGCALGYWRVYLVTSTTFTEHGGKGLARVYGTDWEATILKPAAALESIASGRPVYTAVWISRESLHFRLPWTLTEPPDSN